ncbi:hypothetical protein Ocin01_15024 [Orchesella cincta]|uniref:Transmembrane protein n=1 Tax=Orchesella cincta TaxID=48709 RepID=A0A1D2MFA1_ORCCI|nr:hypothetical protein Ocin01_15024 [Orchesella cincta]
MWDSELFNSDADIHFLIEQKSSEIELEGPIAEVLSTDSVCKPSKIQQLAKFAVQHNITHAAMKDLLGLVREWLPHHDFPKDPRSLLQTPRNLKLIPKSYFERVKTNQTTQSRILFYLPNLVTIKIGIDGLPLSKSSNQFWPILASIDQEQDSSPFIVTLYEGEKKPASINEFLEPFEMLTYNMHSLQHIHLDCKIHGSVDNFSAFEFESYMQVLKRLVRSNRLHLSQVVKRVQEIDDCESFKSYFNEKMFVSTKLSDNCFMLQNASFIMHLLDSGSPSTGNGFVLAIPTLHYNSRQSHHVPVSCRYMQPLPPQCWKSDHLCTKPALKADGFDSTGYSFPHHGCVAGDGWLPVPEISFGYIFRVFFILISALIFIPQLKALLLVEKPSAWDRVKRVSFFYYVWSVYQAIGKKPSILVFFRLGEKFGKQYRVKLFSEEYAYFNCPMVAEKLLGSREYGP